MLRGAPGEADGEHGVRREQTDRQARVQRGEQEDRAHAGRELDHAGRDRPRRPSGDGTDGDDELADRAARDQHHDGLDGERHRPLQQRLGVGVGPSPEQVGEEEPAVGQRRACSEHRDEEHVAHEADQPAAEARCGSADDVRPPAAYEQQRQQGADGRAQRVDHQVVDVEEPVGAVVEVPDAGALGELDQQRDPEPEGGGDDDTAVQHRADEVAERDEQQHVEGDLQERRVAEQRRGPVVRQPDQSRASRTAAAGCPGTGRCPRPASGAACRSTAPARRPRRSPGSPGPWGRAGRRAGTAPRPPGSAARRPAPSRGRSRPARSSPGPSRRGTYR